MQRFIEQQNRAHYRKLLALETDPRLIRILEGLLRSTERVLAMLDASHSGVQSEAQLARDRYLPRATPKSISHFQRELEAAERPWLLLDPGPGLHVVDLNEAYAAATLTVRARVAGERMFEVFPDNPGDPTANGVSMLYKSLKTVSETGQAHEMAVQRYDVRDASGAFVTKFWQPSNLPILDDRGRLLFILHRAEDVTARFTEVAVAATG